MPEWVDCSQPFEVGMPKLGFVPEPEFEVLRELDGAGPKISRLHICTHLGTHVDAPSHFIAGGKDIGDFPASRFIGEAVVWPVEVQAQGAITVPHLEAAPVAPGDSLLLSTGWGRLVQDPKYHDHPHVDREAAAWIVERGVSMLGIDFLTPDMPPPLRPPGFDFPAHRTLLGRDVLIIENLAALDGLAGQRVELMAAPIHVRGGVEAAPVRVLARPVRAA
jgi:kynurenine formamidase